VTTPMRLLVLEDDVGLRASLRLVMEDEGFEVHEAADAERAMLIVDEPGVDLMLVDLMLGGMDGFSFIRRARPHTDAPIVVVSARDRVEDIVAALDAGADDYVTKPFSVEEVLARLRALLRRPSLGDPEGEDEAEDVLTLDADEGPLRFDVGAAVLRRGDEEIHLTQTEFRLLSVLAQNAGRVLSRAALLEHVWDHASFGDERLVDVHVRRLRKKLEPDPGSPRIVVTVRGLGYRLDMR
jgi:DNA-binding response OmpR family regulator